MNWNYIIERCERISEWTSALLVGVTYGCVCALLILIVATGR